MRYKHGDVICFKKDIKAGVEKHVKDRGQVRIPAHTPCTVWRSSNSEIVVSYNQKLIALRYIKERMYPATEMGKVLFAD